MGQVKAEALAKLEQKLEREGIKRQLSIASKYPHAMLDTLTFDGSVNKYACNIHCTLCGDESRKVYTSDLFQVNVCTACKTADQKARKDARKSILKEAMEAFRAKQKAQPKVEEPVAETEPIEEPVAEQEVTA